MIFAGGRTRAAGGSDREFRTVRVGVEHGTVQDEDFDLRPTGSDIAADAPGGGDGCRLADLVGSGPAGIGNPPAEYGGELVAYRSQGSRIALGAREEEAALDAGQD